MKRQDVLIIFFKNPIYGKVKTRLAASIGNDKALQVYNEMAAYTRLVTDKLPCDKIVFYSEHVEPDDIWTTDYLKAVQKGIDLGEKMMNAFEAVFQTGYEKVLVIGTDCPTLKEILIQQAFASLDDQDIVVGPSEDGGYYLLGMKEPHPSLFKDITWSSPTVFGSTIEACAKLNLTYDLLPKLRDVDEKGDLEQIKFMKR